MRAIVCTVLAVFLLAACTKPLDTVIPSNRADWDSKLAPVVQKLGEEDRALFTGYMVRHMMGSAVGAIFGQADAQAAAAIPIGTTIGQAIAEQRQWDVDQAKKAAEVAARQQEEKARAQALKEEAEAKAAALRQQMQDAVTVALVKKSFRPEDVSARRFRGEQLLDVAFKNTGDKVLAGVSGTLVFTDLFEKDVGRVYFKMTEKVPPGGSYIFNGSRDYNEFIAEHRAIKNLQEGQYTTRFETDMIVWLSGFLC